jgi:hypothetical protein
VSSLLHPDEAIRPGLLLLQVLSDGLMPLVWQKNVPQHKEQP